MSLPYSQVCSIHDIGRLCQDMAMAGNESDVVDLAMIFLQQCMPGMDAMGIYLFDQEHAVHCQGRWPETSGRDLAQIMDRCIDNGAVAQALRHGHVSIELPDYVRVTIHVIATRGRDLGLSMAVQKDGDPLDTVHLDEIIATVLAMFAQSLDNLRMHNRSLSHGEQLQRAVDERSKELGHALQQSQAAERAKSIFLATMSHEIRTPMNGILGVLDLLSGGDKQTLPDDYPQLLQTAQASAQHLLVLLNDILDLAKIDAGRTLIRSTPFDLIDCVEGVVAGLMSHEKVCTGAVTLELVNKLSDNRWRQGDSLHLRQILFNLCGNALKFTDQGSVQVIVEDLKESDSGRNYVAIRVQDTGIGIPAEEVATLFDPFHQLDVHRQRGGTGLGLAISHRLCLLMGGELSVHSQQGEGSTFTCKISMPPSMRPAGSREEDTAAHVRAQFPGLRVLCAEDNPVNRLVVKRMLERLGCSVVLADDGEHAWQLYQQGSPDILITDIEMPALNGYELAERLRAYESAHDLPAIPVIALSAHSFVEHKLHADLSGFTTYLAKPVVMNTLAQALSESLKT